MKYKVLVNLKHNGILYPKGEEIEAVEGLILTHLVEKKLIELIPEIEAKEEEEKPKKKKSKEE